ncbi:MAG: RsmD family RNA methyltransferase, partial [Pseudomonadota bacterium]
LGAWPGPLFDLVFLDPPYGRGLGNRALEAARDWCAPGATIVFEEAAEQDAPGGFATLDQRRFGDTWVTMMERV